MTPNAESLATRWPGFVGHALTVCTLALGGLSSFHALRSEVVELRSSVAALVQIESEHTQRQREEFRELRAEFRELKQQLSNGGAP